MNLDHEGSRREFFELLQQLDDPAFVRRAKAVQAAENGLFARCYRDRDELLEFPKLRLATLHALVGGEWSALAELLLDSNDREYLQELHDQWAPELRVPLSRTYQHRKLRKACEELITSFERFNRAWEKYVSSIDLAEVNRARENYNRYYVLEKACAFQSERIARDGFEELLMMQASELQERLPQLSVPAIV